MADKPFTMNRKQPGESRAAARVPDDPEPVSEIDKLMANAAESEANVQTILRETHVKEVLDELGTDLVALEPVKRRIHEIAALLVIDRLRQAHGLSSERPTLHMSFTGNPGTGKTTVALRMAEILKRLGYLEKGHVVSVTRDELVGQYVGHTAPKTKEVIKRSYGGVLFIDEAYYLHRPENERDYGAEAIEILLQVMEADRDKLVVILAGYRDRMDRFFESNPGMGSRVAHHVDFPDYDPAELMEIGELMVNRASYRLSPDAEKALREYVELRIERPRFANGRSIRNAIDRARLRQASRLFESDEQLSKEQLVTIEATDIYSSSVFDEHHSADDDPGSVETNPIPATKA